ncbi:MAG: hypothetical protein AAGB00_08425 [Planctomycetota bacterium]
MSEPTAAEVFDRDFLVVRAKLLEIAASLDRVARAPGEPTDATRVSQLRVAMETLLIQGDDRAERLQQIFSLPYDGSWRDTFGV